MPLPHLRLMTRKQCPLCDEMKEVVEQAAAAGLCSWEPVDVDRDKALLVRFGLDVPVLMRGDEVLFKHRLDYAALSGRLQAVSA